jgi:hypothetical protein
MFAPPVAEPKAKAVAPSKNTSPLHGAAPFGHRLDDDGAEYLHMLQRPIGNQAVPRLSRRQGLVENKHGDLGQDIVPESVGAERGSRGLAWDFSKIPLFPPERMSGEFRSTSQFPASRLPGPPIPAKLKAGAVDDPMEHEAGREADQVTRMPAPGAWGEQPIPETFAGNAISLPTGQTDAGVPVPPQHAPSPPAPPAPAPAGSHCSITSQTLDSAPGGTADTRTTVAVNEIVLLTASASSTWSATAGKINATGTSGTWVSPASAKPVTCTVKATPATGAPCSIDFHVIPPRGQQMTKTADRAYTAGLAGSGFETAALILPLNVSFSGITVREEKVAGEATGYYKDVLKWDKGMHPEGKWARVDAKNNNVKDTIGTPPPGTHGPFGSGTFYWPIPLTWRHPDDTKPIPYGTADQMQVMMDASGAEVTSKEGAERLRTP